MFERFFGGPIEDEMYGGKERTKENIKREIDRIRQGLINRKD